MFPPTPRGSAAGGTCESRISVNAVPLPHVTSQNMTFFVIIKQTLEKFISAPEHSRFLQELNYREVF